MSVQKSNSGPYLDALLAHSAWVRQLARAMASSADVADDVEQEAWRVALERPPKNASNLKAWWARVVRSSAHQRRRSETRFQRRVEQATRGTARSEEGAADVASRMEDSQLLAMLVNDLPPQLGEVIFMRYFDEQTVPQIATRLNVAQTTVKSRLKRGLEQLRNRFQVVHGEKWKVRCLSLATPTSPISFGTVALGLIFMSTPVKILLAATILALASLPFLPNEEPALPLESNAASEVQEVDAIPTEDENEPKRLAIQEAAAARPSTKKQELSNPSHPLPDGYERDAFLEVTALDWDGNPIPDLFFDFNAWPNYAFEKRYYWTDVQGKILVPCISGQWSFRIGSDDRQGGNSADFSDRLDMDPGETARYTVKHPGWGTISGIVLDNQFRPVEGIKVNYWGNNQGVEVFDIRERTHTDSDGRFHFRAMKGEYSVAVTTAHGLAMRTRGVHEEGNPNAELSFRLPPYRTVNLTCLDFNGDPISGSRVDADFRIVQRMSAPQGLQYTSGWPGSLDQQGCIKIDVPSTIEWPIRVESATFGELLFTIPPEVEQYEFRMDRGHSIQGKVVDSTGTAIAGAGVYAWSAELDPSPDPRNIPRDPFNESKWRRTKTDEEGKFLINRLPQSQSGFLFVIAEGMAYSGTQNLQFPTGKDELIVTVYPDQPISGVLLDQQDRPIPGRVIQIEGNPTFGHQTQWMNFSYFADTYRIRTDINGRFRFPGLDGGRWKIWAHRVDGLVEDASAEITAGTQDFVLRIGDGLSERMNADVTVLDANDGTPIQDFRAVMMLPRLRDGEIHGFSGESPIVRNKVPQAEFKSLEVTDCVLMVEAPGYCAIYQTIRGQSGNHEFEARLQPGQIVPISFQDPDGTFRTGIRVQVFDAQGSPIHTSVHNFIHEFGSQPFQGMDIRREQPYKIQLPDSGGTFKITSKDGSKSTTIPLRPNTSSSNDVPLEVVVDF